MWCSTTLEESAESAILISHHSGTGPLHIFLNNFCPDLVAETSRFYLRNGGPSGVPITPRKSLSCPFSTSLSSVTLLALRSFHSFLQISFLRADHLFTTFFSIIVIPLYFGCPTNMPSIDCKRYLYLTRQCSCSGHRPQD